MNKKVLSIIFGLLVGVVLLLLWSNSFDIDYLRKSMTNIKPMYVVISGLCYIFAYVIRSFRWKLLLEKQVAISYKEAWLVSAAGNWINYLIPIRAGELIKAILIKRIKKISAVSIMPSIFFDKFFDTLGIFFVILLIPFVNVKTSYGLKLLIILLLFMFAILFSTMIFAAKNKDSTIKILQRIFFWLPKNISIKIDNLIEIFVNCLNIFDHQKRIISLSLMLTGLGIIFDSLYFYFVFCAFSYNISFLIILFGYTLINLSYVLPQPPAQLGSNEWMMIIIFSLGFGLTKNMASAIMVFAHLFTALIITVLGIIGFTYAGIHSIKQIQKELK